MAVVTQIDVDGTGHGPDLDAYRELLGVSDLPLVASGGVGTLDHLRQLDRPRGATGGGSRG